MSGRVVYFEIPTDDPQRAAVFYGSAFGWDLSSMPGMGYTLASTGPSGDHGPTQPGFINGGMLRRCEEVPSPVITIAVDDMVAALAAIEQNGGSTVRGKEPVGDMGFAAYVKDSEGNVLGLWQNV